MLFSVRTGVEVVITVVGCSQRLQPKRSKRDVAATGTVNGIDRSGAGVAARIVHRYRHITSDLGRARHRTQNLKVDRYYICGLRRVGVISSDLRGRIVPLRAQRPRRELCDSRELGPVVHGVYRAGASEAY